MSRLITKQRAYIQAYPHYDTGRTKLYQIGIRLISHGLGIGVGLD